MKLCASSYSVNWTRSHEHTHEGHIFPNFKQQCVLIFLSEMNEYVIEVATQPSETRHRICY